MKDSYFNLTNDDHTFRHMIKCNKDEEVGSELKCHMMKLIAQKMGSSECDTKAF